MVNQHKLREVIKEVMVKQNLTQEKFAQSVDLSVMMVSYVLAGKRKLSNKKVHKFCEIWNVDFESLLGEDVKLELSLSNLINDLMRIRGIQVDELVERSGINVLTLVEIKRGLREPTKEELKSLCKALEIDYAMIDEKSIMLELQGIREHMERLYLSEEAMRKVMSLLEEEINNRQYI